PSWPRRYRWPPRPGRRDERHTGEPARDAPRGGATRPQRRCALFSGVPARRGVTTRPKEPLTMEPRFTLRQIRYFLAAARAGSVNQAAFDVNISAPSISAAISQ